MARQKKDGAYFSCYIDRELCERMHAYSEDTGATLTAIAEKAVRRFLDEYEERLKRLAALDKLQGP